MQRPNGLFATIQLISNAVLSAKEALVVRDGLRPAPGGDRLTADADEHALPEGPPSPPPAPQAAVPRQEPRTTRMRECSTRHTQARLFTPPPDGDEELCPDCCAQAAQVLRPPLSASPGYAVFAEARRSS